MESFDKICKLPEEVLLKIFSYLPGNGEIISDLLTATLVCKQWNRIISESAELMDKLELKGHHFIEDKSIMLKRHYRKVDFFGDGISYIEKIPRLREIVGTLHKYLVSVRIVYTYVNSDIMSLLATCKNIENLKFDECIIDEEHRTDAIKAVTFPHLKHLSVDEFSSQLLDFFTCKRLISFNGQLVNGAGNTVKFLNQLERLDKLDLSMKKWKSEVELRPKFLWNSMRLEVDAKLYAAYEMDHTAFKNIKAICEASTANSFIKIIFEDRFGEDTDENLFNLILNSCKNISELDLGYGIKVPPQIGPNRQLSEVRTLSVYLKSFEDEQFPIFLMQLPNVTILKIDCSNYIDRITRLPQQKEEVLQPFFAKIIKLNLGWHFLMEENFAHELEFKNATTLSIKISNSEWLKRIKMLVIFCLLNHKVKYLKVAVSCYDWDAEDFIFDELSLISLYNELHARTSIETCEITIDERITWTDQRSKQLQIFGKILNDDEKRFFVFK